MKTKGNGEVVVILIAAIIIIGAIVALFIGDATNDILLTVGGEKFTVDDFKNYVKVWNYEDNSSKDNVSQMFSQYEVYKIYSQRAKKAGLELDGSELPASPESGDEAILLNDFALTSGDYMKVKNEIALAEKLYSSPYELGKVPKDISGDYLLYLYQNGRIKDMDIHTYKFRVIQVPIEQPDEETQNEALSGDVSGEISGDNTKKKEDYETEAREMAEKILALVNETKDLEVVEESRLDSIINYSGESYSGDIFTQIGSKINANRFVQEGTGIASRSNAEVDYVSSYYLDEDYGSSSIIMSWGLASEDLMNGIKKAITAGKKGECSSVFNAGDCFAFVYIEDITEGLNSTDSERFNNEAANYYIEVSANLIQNKSLINKLKVKDIVPKAVQEAATSGDIIVDESDEHVDELFSGELFDTEPQVEEAPETTEEVAK